MDLFDQRRHLPLLATAGSNLNPYDDLRVRIGAELDIVGRAETTVGHLHDRGLGVRRRDPGFLLVVGRLLRLQLGHRLQGLVDPFFPLTGGPFPSLLLPPARFPRIGRHFIPQALYLGLGVLQASLQGRSASERSGPRTGPHTHAVLSHTVEIDQILLH